MEEYKKFIKQHTSELETYFNQTEALAVVVIDEELKITKYNNYFGELISSSKKIISEEIYSFLLPESHALLPLPKETKQIKSWLNFRSIDTSPIPLNCQIFRIDKESHLILGERLSLTSSSILQQMTSMTNEMANMTRNLQKKNRELEEANSKIKVLGGIIPICMHCKKIRDDKGYWEQLEKFISDNSEAQFSHGLCDPCMKELYPEYYDSDEIKKI